MVKFGTLLIALTVAGCSLTRPEEDPVQIKLNDLDTRLARIERVMSNQSLLDLAQRQDANQSEVRALRGQLDQLQNELDTLRKQQRDLYADLDRRLSERDSAPGPGSAPAGPGGGAATGNAEQTAYGQAFDTLKAGHYDQAIAAFKQYLTTYPTGTLSDNAEYWLGECYYVTRDYNNAATAFRTVGERWPNSRKAPDALLKLGFTQIELKQYGPARDTLNQVTQRFPDGEAAKLATERLKHLSGVADTH